MIGEQIAYAAPFRPVLMAIAVAGAAVAVVAAVFDMHDTLRCYLAAVIAVSALPIGALGLMMIMHVVSGTWRAQLYGPAVIVARTLPFAAALFIPIAIFASRIYPPLTVVTDLTPLKATLFQPELFGVRALIYFASWLVLLDRLVRKNERQTTTAVIGLIIFALIGSLAGIDWAMALDANFSSSIYGLIFLGHAVLAGVCAAACVRWFWSRREPSVPAVGSILLACILIWLYFHAMQFIIIWTGDRPDEVNWYIARSHGLWLGILWAAALGGGVIPFFTLLRKQWRRSETVLIRLASLILCVSALECFWLTIPAAPITNADYATLAAVSTLAVTTALWCVALNHTHQCPAPAMKWGGRT